jgi:3-dehydroquinate synthase
MVIKEVSKKLSAEVHAKYMENAAYLEDADSHAVHPTSTYRQCDALTLATPDAATIESVMSASITTTIKITRNVLDPSNHRLLAVYKPLGRCVAAVDDNLDKYYDDEIDSYSAANNIEFTKLGFSGNEVDKGIEDVERISVVIKKYRVSLHEPLLVVGGGVISDIAGFATSLYSRHTPHVMLRTSIVSGIDAGPSLRECCNSFDYTNLYGLYMLVSSARAYHHRPWLLEDPLSWVAVPWCCGDHQDGCHEGFVSLRAQGEAWP